jgi:hypothetical protein
LSSSRILDIKNIAKQFNELELVNVNCRDFVGETEMALQALEFSLMRLEKIPEDSAGRAELLDLIESNEVWQLTSEFFDTLKLNGPEGISDDMVTRAFFAQRTIRKRFEELMQKAKTN